jgi:energy-coupling factor transporter ATP-binding protein EcfA2
MEFAMLVSAAAPDALLVLENVRKTLTAGYGATRVRVTVLGGVSLTVRAGQAVAITGALPMARSLLCAIAAGVARADSGRVRWGARGSAGVRYAAIGDAPRVLHRLDGTSGGLVVLDASLIEDAPPPDLRTTALLLRPWLTAGGAAILSVPHVGDDWPWFVRELTGGQLRDPRVLAASMARTAGMRARAVAESRPSHGMADPPAHQ